MSLLEFKKHIETETKSFITDKENYLITSVLQFHSDLYPKCFEILRNNKLDDDNFKWAIYKLKDQKQILFIEIMSDLEIKKPKNRNKKIICIR